jgi:hypothetical protein
MVPPPRLERGTSRSTIYGCPQVSIIYEQFRSSKPLTNQWRPERPASSSAISHKESATPSELGSVNMAGDSAALSISSRRSQRRRRNRWLKRWQDAAGHARTLSLEGSSRRRRCRDGGWDARDVRATGRASRHPGASAVTRIITSCFLATLRRSTGAPGVTCPSPCIYGSAPPSLPDRRPDQHGGEGHSGIRRAIAARFRRSP